MKILCVGQLVADILVLPVESLDYATDTTAVEQIELLPGGDAMNVTLNLARLGAETAFIGRVGDDEFGKMLHRALMQAGVDSNGLGINPEFPTDTSLVLINSQGDRTFYYRGGATGTLAPAHISDAQLAGSGIVFIGGTFSMPYIDGEGAKDIFARAHKHGAVTAMDVNHDTKGRWMDLIGPSLTELDYFLPSLSEAKYLTGEDQPEAIARKLRETGIKTAVIKLGEKGCYVQSETESFYQEAFPAKAVDTTGAGDSFVAGFLFGLSQELPLRECARIGCAAGAITVGILGATAPNLTHNIIKNFLKRSNHDSIG
ncbi:MAG: carbohydrate kinase family protein [Defluviitaleaceae bacterium]|nr:carbohydrate kinase family protein [Defluviitaleaceae bacterium]